MSNNNEPVSSDAFSSDLLRGHTDTIVLGTLRDAERYGFEIYKTIRDATGGDYEIKEATLYATFRRLVKDGFVDAYWGSFHFWAFNVADSAITVGVALVILDMIGTGTHASNPV